MSKLDEIGSDVVRAGERSLRVRAQDEVVRVILSDESGTKIIKLPPVVARAHAEMVLRNVKAIELATAADEPTAEPCVPRRDALPVQPPYKPAGPPVSGSRR